MKIDDTIGAIIQIRRSIGEGIARTITRPDALIAELNDLYIEAAGNRDLDELFEYDDIGSPTITLRVGTDVGFDLKEVVKRLRTRLRALPPVQADEIGTAGIVWSAGRYDFVYDDDSRLLRISHRYSHKRVDTKSVLSIIERMMDYALDYLKEVRKSVRENADATETE